MDLQQRRRALERFEEVIEVPLLALALAMVPIIVVPLVVSLPPPAAATVEVLDWFIWAVFAVQYLVRLALTTERWRFVRREWLDLFVIVLPFLRPLRIVRSVRLLGVLRLARLAAFLGVVGQEGRRILTRHRLHYVLFVALVLLLGSAGLAYVAEVGDGGGIESYGDALWWALTTLTTVGYGDLYPLTPAGRGIGALLMLVGIAVFGVVTANVASLFIERTQAGQDGGQPGDGDAEKLDEILARLGSIEAELLALRGGSTSGRSATAATDGAAGLR